MLFRSIRIVMSVALLIVAGLMLAGQLKLFPLGGSSLGLSGWKLVIGIVGNFIFGALMTVGIGLYAPCMVMIYLLGMNPLAAFPVMMCSCAFLSFFSSASFMRHNRFNSRATVTIALIIRYACTRVVSMRGGVLYFSDHVSVMGCG